MLTNEELQHYGVKGMRWGVRRTSKQLARAKKERSEDAKNKERGQAKIKKSGTDALSNKELREVTNRINLENNYKSATANAKRSGGRKFVGEVLKGQGKSQANQLVNKGLGAAFTAAGALVMSRVVLDFKDMKI